MITVIIPTYNREANTNRAIQSVLLQNLEAEIIVIDDASDKPLSLSKDIKATSRVKLIQKDKNEGPAAARNLAIEVATQPLISFLDSDDYLLENTLQLRVEYAIKKGILTEEGKNQIIGCSWQESTAAGEVYRTRHPRRGRISEDFFSGCWFCPGSAIILNRNLFTDSNIRFDENLKRLEDLDLFMRLSMNGLKYEAHHLTGVSITTSDSRNPDVVIEACEAIKKKYLSNKTGLAKRLQANLEAYLFYELSRAYISKFEFHKALAFLVKSFIKKPRTSLYPGPGWSSTPN